MAAHCVTQELPQTAVSMKQEPAADMDSVQSLTQQEQQDEELASHKVKVEIEADMDQNWNIKQEWLEAWEEPVHHDYDLSILKVETKDEITTEDHSISLGERSGAFSNASSAEEISGPVTCNSGESLYSVRDYMSPSGEKMYEEINGSKELPSESGSDTGIQLCKSEEHEEQDIEHCNLNHHLRINELASHKVKEEIETDMEQNWNVKQEWLEAWEEPVHHDYDLSILKVETKDEITTEDHSISLGERSGAFSNASTAEEKSGPGKCSCRESLYSVCDCMSPSGEKMYEKINDSSELPSESGADTGLQLCISEDHEEDDIEHCNLNHHLRINVSDIDHRCSECGICFKSKYILRQHLKLHYEKQINKCEECGKCFNSKSILRQHLKLHYEKKIHKCEECGKCFVRSYTLKQHLLIHTGVKDYKCPTCGNSFMYNT